MIFPRKPRPQRELGLPAGNSLLRRSILILGNLRNPRVTMILKMKKSTISRSHAGRGETFLHLLRPALDPMVLGLVTEPYLLTNLSSFSVMVLVLGPTPW